MKGENNMKKNYYKPEFTSESSLEQTSLACYTASQWELFDTDRRCLGVKDDNAFELQTCSTVLWTDPQYGCQIFDFTIS